MNTVPNLSHEAQHQNPIDRVISRFARVKQAGPARWIASCPTSRHPHGDRSRGLSIRETEDGTVLLHDFGGCSSSEILSAVGLEWSDLFRKTDTYTPKRKLRPVRSTYRLPQSIAEVFLSSPAFAYGWELAKLLSLQTPLQAQRDVLAGWDYLADRVDIPAVMQLSNLIREVAIHTYSDPSKADEQESQRAIRRLLEEVAA